MLIHSLLGHVPRSPQQTPQVLSASPSRQQEESMSSLPRCAARLLLSLFFLTQNLVLILLGTIVHGSAAEALGLPTGCRLRLLAVPWGMAKATPALVQGPPFRLPTAKATL